MTSLRRYKPSEVERYTALSQPLPPFEFLKTASYYAVDVRDGIFVQVFGESGEERFVHVFRSVWQKIPVNTRKLIVDHWRNSDTLWLVSPLWSPQIKYHGLVDKKFGYCTIRGHELGFNADTFELMPDTVGEREAFRAINNFHNNVINDRTDDGLTIDVRRRIAAP